MAETLQPRGDISSLLANSAQTNADFDFGKINRSYWEGLDQNYKQRTRDVFKDGIPTNADGTPDYTSAAKKLYQLGDVNTGNALSNLDIQRQQLQLGQEASRAMGGIERGGQPPLNVPIVGPSTSRNGATPVAPPVGQNARPATAPQPNADPQPGAAPQGRAQGDQPGSIVGMISSAGVPDELAGPLIQQVSAATRMDPNAAVDPKIAPRVQQIVAAAAQRMRQGNQGPSPQATPPTAPQPQSAPAVVDARGNASTTIDPNIQQRAAQYTQIMSNPALPQSVRDAAKMRLEALQTNSSLTGTQKEYEQAVRQGFKGTIEDWQNRADENTTQRDILTKSLLPKVDKSQEAAAAARDDISAIYRSREELDQKGGVFAGQFADKMKFLAKVGAFFGIPDDGKIQNTEAYGAAIGSRVAAMVKAFGSGTAISDGDRRFAADMAGGNITLDEKSMRRILEIGERAARGKIDTHNKLVDEVVGANDSLKGARKSFIVEAPGQYQRPKEQQRQAPQQGSFSKGQTATNPQTKQRIVFDGAQWVPAQ